MKKMFRSMKNLKLFLLIYPCGVVNVNVYLTLLTPHDLKCHNGEISENMPTCSSEEWIFEEGKAMQKVRSKFCNAKHFPLILSSQASRCESCSLTYQTNIIISQLQSTAGCVQCALAQSKVSPTLYQSALSLRRIDTMRSARWSPSWFL